MGPKVSVVIAVFRDVQWLPVTLGTILDQSYTDFEVIVVDDGNDFSDSLFIEGLSVIDSRIRVLRNDINIGLTPSLYRGCAEAEGNYIARIDNGDLMVPNTRFQEQVNLLESDKGLVIVGGKTDVADCINGILWRSQSRDRDHDELKSCANGFRTSFSHVTVMFKKAAYIQAGGYCITNETGQDSELWGRLLKIGKGYEKGKVYAVAPMRNQSISVARNNRQIINKARRIRRKSDRTNFLANLILSLREYVKLTIPIRLRMRMRYSKNYYPVRRLSRLEVDDINELLDTYLESM